jgi:hypothetical protein
MSTMNVRNYLGAPQPSPEPGEMPRRFPTHGARNRIAAALICEKEGFDELLEAEQIPERYDLALMSTKGISALAARDLAESMGVPCFTLHDLDKNGLVMRAGFPFATDLGIRFDDVTEWALAPEGQAHKNPAKTAENLRANGATQQEIDFIAFQGSWRIPSGPHRPDGSHVCREGRRAGTGALARRDILQPRVFVDLAGAAACQLPAVEVQKACSSLMTVSTRCCGNCSVLLDMMCSLCCG